MMQLVLVEWQDPYSYGGWHTPNEDLDRIAECITVGILCIDNERQITVAQNRSITSGNIGDTISIPKASIKRIRELRVKGV